MKFKQNLFLLILILPFLSFSQDISEGLLLHYNWNGTFEDQSGNEYDGIATGTTFVEDRFGNPGKACHFDGISDFISMPNLAELKPNLPITIAFWLKHEDLYYEYASVFNTSFQDDVNSGLFFTISNATHEYAVGYGDGDSGYSSSGLRRLSSTAVADITTWHHITLVVSGPTDMEIYVDCHPTGDEYVGSGGSIAYSSGAGTIGKHDRNTGDPGDFFKGYLDDFRYYNRALSAEEVAILCTVKDEDENANLDEKSILNEELLVYPNPSTHEINFKIEDPSAVNYLYISDMLGNKIYSGPFVRSLDVQNLPAGVYIVRIENARSSSITKFIKE
ncbi:LamG-like jellyroll fold domain-containing protein [Crocinitomix catalasitica]|uniref:LamG-like jellyroll fold domain-containing protein n=1 Tax=Crocinitomix catalasitica TaxID=184607 RepID=UPI0012FB7C24|nr:LamG-like jellyroll fold domain-containing protein [Crocinitomix catalasitica]